jgi:hypothetical protein
MEESSMKSIQIAPNALWRREGEGIVILEEITGEPYHLDEVGAFLFEKLQHPHTFEELVSLASEEYQGREEQFRCDIQDFLDVLLRLELLQAREGSVSTT